MISMRSDRRLLRCLARSSICLSLSCTCLRRLSFWLSMNFEKVPPFCAPPFFDSAMALTRWLALRSESIG